MSPEVVKLSYRAVIDYMVGQNEEYKRLVEQALAINQEVAATSVNTKAKCKYIRNKVKIDAYIDWQTGVITDENGAILRRGNKCGM